ncbi:hypothetical protein ANN_11156 [Periplaneta americana]|uniref:Uncharacterized protein n=1 Tax=Periplaneta americana TaxID=6978 RepID=A0ABQ8T5W9_PERAM|nr:hypothetical protein ANN_11156 [Periplaneta americana]
MIEETEIPQENHLQRLLCPPQISSRPGLGSNPDGWKTYMLATDMAPHEHHVDCQVDRAALSAGEATGLKNHSTQTGITNHALGSRKFPPNTNNCIRLGKTFETLGRPRRRWEDNIKMDLREVGYDDTDWINLAQDRDHGGGGLCEGGNEPPGSLKASVKKQETSLLYGGTDTLLYSYELPRQESDISSSPEFRSHSRHLPFGTEKQ